MNNIRKHFARAWHAFRRSSPYVRFGIVLAVLSCAALSWYALPGSSKVATATVKAQAGQTAARIPADAPASALIALRGQLAWLEVREGSSSFEVKAGFRDGSERAFHKVSPFGYKTLQDMLAADIGSGRVALRLSAPLVEADDDWSAAKTADMAIKVLSVVLLLGTVVLIAFKPTLLDGRAKTAELIKPDANTDSFHALIGLEDVKAEVMQLKALYEDADLYRSYGIEKPFNVLFSGPAGVGKTRLAGALAKELDLPLLHASGSSLESGFVGGGSRALKSIVKQARKHKRAVVFLDEAQVLLVKRGNSNNHTKFADDTTNTLLSILDGVSRSEDRGIIWIVASNFDDQNMEMDDAMMRRFPLKVNFRLPNLDEREQILRHYLEKRASRVAPGVDVGHVAEVTAGLAPALLESIVERASLMAVQEDCIIDDDVLMRAFERIAVGLTDRKTTEHHKQARKIIAVHELGHFFVTLDEALKKSRSLEELKRNIPVLKISTEAVSKGGALGFVLMRQKDSPLQTRTELEGYVRGLYGGVAAEEIFFGEENITTGAYDDIRKATELLKKMVVELAMYSTSKVNMSLLGGEADKHSGAEEVKAHADRLFRDALVVVERYKDTIATLSDEIVVRYTFGIDEILQRLVDMNVIDLPAELAIAA